MMSSKNLDTMNLEGDNLGLKMSHENMNLENIL